MQRDILSFAGFKRLRVDSEEEDSGEGQYY